MTGCEKLNAWLEKTGVKQKWVAAKMGVPESTVSAWVTGRHAPVLDNAVLLEKATGGAVKVQDWGPLIDA